MFKTVLRLVLCVLVAAGGLIAWGDSGSGVSGYYWFDAHGEKHQFTPGSLEIPTDGLEEGFHTFNAYVTDSSAVSSTHSGLFLKVSRQLSVNEPLTCSFYIDGKAFLTREVPVGADGTLGIDLDINSVDLGLHSLDMTLTSEKGIPMGYRSAVFMRVPTDLQRSTFSVYYYLDGKFIGTLDADTNNSFVHLDIDASALSTGLHWITAYMASPHGMATSARTAWFIKIPAGGEGVSQYSYWINDNSETLRTVELPEVSNPFSLVRLMDVPEQPFRSKSYTFAIEDAAPALYACNDFQICFTDPDGRVSTGSRTYTDPRVKVIPEEADTIVNGRNTTGVIASNTVKLFSFDAEIGDSINISLDRAAMLEVYAPDAEALFRVSGADATANRTFTARQNGTYYVAVHDIASGISANVDFRYIHKFALLEQSVTHSADRGVFEMEVIGNGFDSLDSLVLTDGNIEMPVKEFRAVDNNNLYVMLDFDENKPALGEYRLKGRFTDKEKSSIEEILSSSSLTVETVSEGAITVDIDAPRIAGTPYLAYIRVTNHSNVGQWGIPFNIAAQHAKNGGRIDFMDFGITIDEKYKDILPVVHETDDLLGTGKSGKFAPAVIPYLAPGETKTYTIGLTTSPHEIVSVYAWTGKSWSEEITEVLADGYDLSVIQKPFEGNLFSFIEFCKLYYQLENRLYETESAVAPPVKGNTSLRDVANNAAGLAKQGVGLAAHASKGYLSTRMAGREMLLEMTGSNEYVERMQDIDRGMLAVGNDLMAIGDTLNNLIGNSQALNHLMNARNYWKEAVPANPPASSESIDCYQSGDPNEMSGYQSPSGTNHIGRDVRTLSYTIEFENDPEIANASASKINVKSIVDGSSLDLSSLKALRLSIGDKVVELPEGHHFVKTLDMRPAINSIAELTFDFDVTTGLAEWNLRSLDPLTLEDITYMDDGILPVNNDSGSGIGHLTFSVDLRQKVSDGTSISTKADIVFDNNAPISTPVWTNVTDFTLPRAKIVSQSTADNLNFDFTVEGSDSGSGIWFYDLYMKPAGSSRWTAVRTEISGDTFTYTSDEVLENVTFAVLATDRAGNRQSEASLDGIAGDADGNGAIDSNDVVATRNYYLGQHSGINTINADVTGDGSIDTQDATAIINLYLNKAESKSLKTFIIR